MRFAWKRLRSALVAHIGIAGDGRRHLPKFLPKKCSETRGDNRKKVVRESPGHRMSVGPIEM